MADYKELLRKAVEALPENNGAARRAVYEKARAALVGQLRAINPPLPARDITTHRLQLEDCIRQVEQEASEAVIANMGGATAELPPPPVYFDAASAPQPKAPAQAAKPAPGKPVLVPREPKALPAGGSIEDIIAAANADAPAAEAKPKRAAAAGKPVQMRLASPALKAPEPVEDESEIAAAPEPEVEEPELPPPAPAARPNGRPLPSIVARAEAARSRPAPAAFGAVPDGARRGPQLDPRQAPRLEPAARGNQAVARQQEVEPEVFGQAPQVVAAMSAVREVELEAEPQVAVDPQGAIDRAIATLDREARAEREPRVNGVDHDETERRPTDGKARGLAAFMPAGRKPGARQPAPLPNRAAAKGNGRAALAATGRRNREEERDAVPFPRAKAQRERGGISAITIFLIVFAVLLAGTGGAGYWAVSQGYVDLSTMFSPAPQQQGAATDTPSQVTADTQVPATGPGNTAAPAVSPAPVTELAGTERLTPDPALTGSQPLGLAATPPAPAEERLESADQATTAEAAVAALDSSSIAGSQSLLLEASADGRTGAVPFSGTVDWSRGTDETGQPTLVGKANIPARNLAVDVLIRRNADPSLPASHLMEVNFRVSDSFIGGSIAGLPGVLLKNEELVQGTPLVGASARIVGNSFLFALSASPEDLANNTTLLTSRKWMDLALIYATGTRAIITLEKDAAATALFNEVVDAWKQAS